MSEELLAIVTSETEVLMSDPLAIQVVQEIILTARADKVKALDAIAALAGGNPSDEKHIIKLPFTARVYKTLVQGGHYNAKERKVEGDFLEIWLTIVVDPPLEFAGKLYQAIKPEVVQWALGEGSFVIVGLLEVLTGDEIVELRAQLKSKQSVLQTNGKDNKGTKIILEKIV